MSTESSRKRRQELRDMGYQAAEIWLPKDLVHELDQIAKKNNVTRSKIVEQLVLQGKKAMGSSKFFFFFNDGQDQQESTK